MPDRRRDLLRDCDKGGASALPFHPCSIIGTFISWPDISHFFCTRQSPFLTPLPPTNPPSSHLHPQVKCVGFILFSCSRLCSAKLECLHEYIIMNTHCELGFFLLNHRFIVLFNVGSFSYTGLISHNASCMKEATSRNLFNSNIFKGVLGHDNCP